MHQSWNRAASALALCIALAAPAGPGGASATEPAVSAARPGASIEVVSAVSHPAAAAAVGVVYLRIVNHASHRDRLIGVETPAAQRAELHETLVESVAIGELEGEAVGGAVGNVRRELVRMLHRPEGFEMAAGGQLVLESGGKHIMLQRLQSPLAAGDSFELDLIFERAARLRLRVPVRPRHAGQGTHGGPR